MRVEIIGKMPRLAHPNDACFDCFAAEDTVVLDGDVAKIPLGFRIAIPVGYEGQIRGRSGLNSRGLICLFGTIDSDYRGEVCCLIYNTTGEDGRIFVGDRVCQLAIRPVPAIEFVSVDSLPVTARGEGGFGSTGR